MKKEIKCPNCKMGEKLQKPLKYFPEEMEFYKCMVCSSVWELEKHVSLKELLEQGDEVEQEEKQIKDIRLHKGKGASATIQVNYGDGWEKIKINIE